MLGMLGRSGSHSTDLSSWPSDRDPQGFRCHVRPAPFGVSVTSS